MDRGEFEKIFRLTSERGIYLMTDECYYRFLYDSEPFSIASLPGAKETVLVAGSLSKTYAMTGWRIGFGLVPAPIHLLESLLIAIGSGLVAGAYPAWRGARLSPVEALRYE